MVHVITDFTLGDNIWIRYQAWQEIERNVIPHCYVRVYLYTCICEFVIE
jgi:hypothetical protein